jgi:hypothetical protein
MRIPTLILDWLALNQPKREHTQQTNKMHYSNDLFHFLWLVTVVQTDSWERTVSRSEWGRAHTNLSCVCLECPQEKRVCQLSL